MPEIDPQRLAALAKEIKKSSANIRQEVTAIVDDAESKMHQHLIDDGRQKLETIKKKLKP